MKRKKDEVEVFTRHDLFALWRRGQVLPPKRKKYPDIPEPEAEPKAEPEPRISIAEWKVLARLVARLGPEAVADAARKVPLPRGRGRPKERNSLDDAENLLWFIEKYTEEAKQDRSRHPVSDALNAACEATGRALKTIKEKRRAAKKLVARMKKGPD